MRMMRRAGLLGNAGHTHRVQLSASAPYTNNRAYVSIDGVDYQASGSGWSQTLYAADGTAATAYVNRPESTTVSCSIIYLGETVAQTNAKQAAASYDFIIDRPLQIVYSTDNFGGYNVTITEG